MAEFSSRLSRNKDYIQKFKGNLENEELMRKNQ